MKYMLVGGFRDARGAAPVARVGDLCDELVGVRIRTPVVVLGGRLQEGLYQFPDVLLAMRGPEHWAAAAATGATAEGVSDVLDAVDPEAPVGAENRRHHAGALLSRPYLVRRGGRFCPGRALVLVVQPGPELSSEQRAATKQLYRSDDVALVALPVDADEAELPAHGRGHCSSSLCPWGVGLAHPLEALDCVMAVRSPLFLECYPSLVTGRLDDPSVIRVRRRVGAEA